ncbi:hypothetical protein [Nocardiopsis sp. MG754419]|uniref:hypothetical protein n=1 Tax=Nocardiopsis sp. MG754419 TaxID=2259865 RepID=UPI001BAB0D85|nr:hypothetical protein [Nocardiopsis sp. MG754419]
MSGGEDGFIERVARSRYLLPFGFPNGFPESPTSREWRRLIISNAITSVGLLSISVFGVVQGSLAWVGLWLGVGALFFLIACVPKMILWRRRGSRD